jgi:hypothetical protein
MSNLLHLDSEEMRDKFGHEPFKLTHELVGHPMTSLDALAELAEEVPLDLIEHNVGEVPEVADPNAVAQADLPPAEIVRGIETNGCWIVIPIHASPRYESFLDDLIAEVRPLLRPDEGEIRHQQGVFLLSAPGKVTPTHVDSEQGFLLQFKGDKEMRLGQFADSKTRELQIENVHAGGHRNLTEKPEAMTTYHLDPGEGVHVPGFYPHMVKNGDSVSLSINFAFLTDATIRHQNVYSMNARLRKLGLNPSPPGARPRADRHKERLAKTAAKLTSRR